MVTRAVVNAVGLFVERIHLDMWKLRKSTSGHVLYSVRPAACGVGRVRPLAETAVPGASGPWRAGF
jgi:hypothetical protein